MIQRATQLIIAGLVLMVMPFGARGDITVPGADGSDEALNPTQSIQIDLGLALPRTWDTPSPIPSRGVYDSEKWAVVFKYSSVSIPSGVTVTFKNHPSRAPVVWLVSGDVNIAGTLNLDGASGPSTVSYAEPGPGGFRGGALFSSWLAPGSAGFGPGGGHLRDNNSSLCSGHAGYGSAGTIGTNCRSDTTLPPAYGNKAILPLLGGSGGGPWSTYGGSAGGGAILIAAQRTIYITGAVRANGGTANYYGASGGAIRLVANSVTGTGQLRAQPSWANPSLSLGRIRVEANSISITDRGAAVYSEGLPGTTATLWPAATAPRVRVASVGGQTVPTDPRARLDFPAADLTLTNSQWAPVVIQADNVPLSWHVALRVVPKQGQDSIVEAYLVSGDEVQSTWQAYVTLPSGFAAVQARAYEPGAALLEAGSEEGDQPTEESQTPPVEEQDQVMAAPASENNLSGQ